MALTDIFVTQFLLQETAATLDGVCWRELDSGAYETHINGINVQLEQCQDRVGAWLCLTVSAEPEKVYISEPRSTSLIGRKYPNEDDRTLAELLRALMESVVAQCEERRRRSAERTQEIRQQILHRLVFGQEARVR
jgi:hypothetical protein